MNRGRPPGTAHPLSMKDFWVLVLEKLIEVQEMRLAYEAAEVEVLERYGRTRFGSYASFRVMKVKFYRSKKKKQPC